MPVYLLRRLSTFISRFVLTFSYPNANCIVRYGNCRHLCMSLNRTCKYILAFMMRTIQRLTALLLAQVMTHLCRPGQSMLSVVCVPHCSNSTKLTPSGIHSMDCPHDRGRCVPRAAVYTPVTAPVRHARCGDYEPPGEAATMLERQRQTRRIKSLLDLLRKYGTSYQTGELAAQQWNAIWNSTGYRGSFITWVLDWPEICLVGFDCPSSDQLTISIRL